MRIEEEVVQVDLIMGCSRRMLLIMQHNAVLCLSLWIIRNRGWHHHRDLCYAYYSMSISIRLSAVVYIYHVICLSSCRVTMIVISVYLSIKWFAFYFTSQLALYYLLQVTTYSHDDDTNNVHNDDDGNKHPRNHTCRSLPSSFMGSISLTIYMSCVIENYDMWSKGERL